MNLTLPPYTRALPNDARLNAKELAQIMGCSNRTISRLVIDGKFPKPDLLSGNNRGHTKKHGWSMKLLREFESENN